MKLKFSTIEKITGNIMDVKDPIYGIKLRKNERIPKAIAKSLLKRIKITKVKIPVRKLVKDFILK